MVALTEKRDSLPKSKFGLQGGKRYSMPDSSHARNAKARPSRLPVDLRFLARRYRPLLLDRMLEK